MFDMRGNRTRDFWTKKENLLQESNLRAQAKKKRFFIVVLVIRTRDF